MEKTVVVIAGPTCTGKSDTAVRLAERISGEIVNADSMQVYRGMDIGTAKTRPEQMRGIPHHMFNVADPEDGMKVSEFRESALSCIDDILARNKIPIIVGGTGFYIDSLLFEAPVCESGTDPEYRDMLRKKADSGGLEGLYSELSEKDPEYAASIHPNNRVRVIRALEYIRSTGRPYSEYAFARGSARQRFPFRCFVLDDERGTLYSRINMRVDTMISEGFADEVRALISRGIPRDSVCMQGAGYRQMYDAVTGTLSPDEAAESVKTETRRIAKRQLTWFRHVDYAEWVDISEFGRDPSAVADELVRRLST